MPDARQLAERYVDLALGGRGGDAVELLLAPVAAGELELETLYEQILAPAAEQVGELWYTGRIGVADEHYATQLSQQVIAAAAALGPRPAARETVVVLACPPDELHDVGVRMLGHLLTAHGFVVHMLGALTPVRDLVRYVERVDADAVGLSVTSPISIAGLAAAAEALAALDPRPRIFIGGRCAVRYPATARAAGADATCRTVAETIAFLDGA